MTTKSNTYWIICNEVTEARDDSAEANLESFGTLEAAFAAADARGIEPSFYWNGKSWLAFWDAFKGEEEKYCSGVDVEG